jgi:hypothetical protein
LIWSQKHIGIQNGQSNAFLSSPLQQEIDFMIADSKKFHASVQSEKVFNLSDYLLFGLLTVVSFAAIGGVPLVVENREGVFSRYPKKESGS